MILHFFTLIVTIMFCCELLTGFVNSMNFQEFVIGQQHNCNLAFRPRKSKSAFYNTPRQFLLAFNYKSPHKVKYKTFLTLTKVVRACLARGANSRKKTLGLSASATGAVEPATSSPRPFCIAQPHRSMQRCYPCWGRYSRLLNLRR